MWNDVKKIVGNQIDNFQKDIIKKAMCEDINAIYKIGRLYEQGLEVPMDNTKAFQIFELCAREEMLDAQIRLAEKLFRGQGVKKNGQKAKDFLTVALKSNKIMAYILMGDILLAENKKADAISYYLNAEKIFQTDNQKVSIYTMAIMYAGLSTLYLSEEEKNRNPEFAVKYMDKALKEDVFCNAKAIGDLFFYGNGIEKDNERAKFYYSRIAEEDTCDTCGCDCKDYCIDKLNSITAAEVWQRKNNV